jgi:hypothetical protein
MFYAGDEYADDEATSGPLVNSEHPDFEFVAADFDSERQAAQDEYDEMYPQGESR